MKEHELKTWPEFFDSLMTTEKKFEIRNDDRHFQVGDILVLREWSPIDGYSGRKIKKIVTYVLRSHKGLLDGFVILSIDSWY
jgi:hypothetical protein